MNRNSFADILKEIDRRQDRKIIDKIPSLSGIKVPAGLSLEQCSSEAAALHKASLAALFAEDSSVGNESSALPPGNGTLTPGGNGMNTSKRIADLTGGLGVDCWAFTRHFDAVYYNEMKPDLVKATEENFTNLGISGTEFHNDTVKPEDDGWKTALGRFRPDIIYLDPARRDNTGKKVFLLEDCSPNILQLMPDLLSIAPKLMVKLSPMADISLIAKRLSGCCMEASGSSGIRSVYVVGFDGECKELLCLIDRNWQGPFSVLTEEISKDGSVKASSGNNSESPLKIASEKELIQGRILLIPTSSAMKSGCHERICAETGIAKLDRFTNIYIAAQPEIGRLGTYKEFFRIYTVEEILPFNNASIKELGRRYPNADVSAKNIPMTSEELRSRITGGKKRSNVGSSSPAVLITGFSTPYGRFLACLSHFTDCRNSQTSCQEN